MVLMVVAGPVIPLLLSVDSQIFGRLLMAAGFEGMRYPFTKGQHNCIAVFLNNLDGSDSYIELFDEPPSGVL